MHFFVFAFAVILTANLSHGRSLASVRKDAFTVGVNKGDSATEYNFISEMTKKMKFPRFRLVTFENANAGQKLLLDGKIDAIISRVNYSKHLESKFLLSAPYAKADIAVATLAKNKVWTLADINGKSLAFIPRDISNEQVLGIWRNSKLNANQSLDDAFNSLRNGEVVAIVASRQSLEAQKDSLLQIFPNKLLENNIVALFAPGSNALQEEFNKNIIETNVPLKPKGDKSKENLIQDKERLAKIMVLLNELKKEIEILQEGLK